MVRVWLRFFRQRSLSWWGDAVSSERRGCGGGATAGPEPEPRAGAGTRAAAARGRRHSLHPLRASHTPSARYTGVLGPGGAQADVEGHRRRSQESLGQPPATSPVSGGSSLSDSRRTSGDYYWPAHSPSLPLHLYLGSRYTT
jgi:hypothetical protein